MSVKMLKIYDKNGNEKEIKASLKECFVGKGWFLKAPKKEEGKANG